MTPDQTARFFALRKMDDRTSEEDVEYQELWSHREKEIMRMIPVPSCCTAARAYPAVWFIVNYDDGDSHEAPGFWHLVLGELSRDIAHAHDPHFMDEDLPKPKFCPYCGTALPKMQRKNPIPETVCRVEDGGYYCSTCKERLQNCICDPMSSAFKPC